MPESTGMLALASTLFRFVSSERPGSREKPRWISKWVRVALMSRM